MDDPSVSPVAPIGTEPVDALEPAVERVPASDADVRDVRGVGPGASDAEAQVDVPTTRAQLEDPIVAPPASEMVADVHDAAKHGNPIANAIERAQTVSPVDHAQHLGGAAASAASGQAVPREDPPAIDESEREPRVDPLGSTAPTTGVHARDAREDA